LTRRTAPRDLPVPPIGASYPVSHPGTGAPDIPGLIDTLLRPRWQGRGQFTAPTPSAPQKPASGMSAEQAVRLVQSNAPLPRKEQAAVPAGGAAPAASQGPKEQLPAETLSPGASQEPGEEPFPQRLAAAVERVSQEWAEKGRGVAGVPGATVGAILGGLVGIGKALFGGEREEQRAETVTPSAVKPASAPEELEPVWRPGPGGAQASGVAAKEAVEVTRPPITPAEEQPAEYRTPPGTVARAWEKRGTETSAFVPPERWPEIMRRNVAGLAAEGAAIGQRLLGGAGAKAGGAVGGALGVLTGLFQGPLRVLAWTGEEVERLVGAYQVLSAPEEVNKLRSREFELSQRAKQAGSPVEREELSQRAQLAWKLSERYDQVAPGLADRFLEIDKRLDQTSDDFERQSLQEEMRRLAQDVDRGWAGGAYGKPRLGIIDVFEDIGRALRANRQQWELAKQAAHIGAYTPGLAYHAWVRMAYLGEDPEQVADELIPQRNELMEFVGQAAFDPINLVDWIPAEAVRALRLRKAARYVAPIDEPIEAMAKQMAAGRVRGLRSVIRAFNPFALTTEAERARVLEESSDVMRLVLTSARPGEETALLHRWIQAAESEEKLREFAQLVRQPVVLSRPGKRTALLLRAADEQGRMSKAIVDIAQRLKEGKLKPDEAAVEALRVISSNTERALSGLMPDVPTVYERIFDPLLKMRARLDARLSEIYMGLNPGYAFRNAFNNFATAVVDGVMPFESGSQINRYIERFGAWPTSAAKGIGAAEAVAPAPADITSLLRQIAQQPARAFSHVAQVTERWFANRIVYKGVRQSMAQLWPRRAQSLVRVLSNRLGLTEKQAWALAYHLSNAVNEEEVLDVLRRFFDGDPSALKGAIRPHLQIELIENAPEAAEELAKAPRGRAGQVPRQAAATARKRSRQAATVVPPRGSAEAEALSEAAESAQQKAAGVSFRGTEQYRAWRRGMIQAELRLYDLYHQIAQQAPQEAERLATEIIEPVRRARDQIADLYFKQPPGARITAQEMGQRTVAAMEEAMERLQQEAANLGLQVQARSAADFVGTVDLSSPLYSQYVARRRALLEAEERFQDICDQILDAKPDQAATVKRYLSLGEDLRAQAADAFFEPKDEASRLAASEVERRILETYDRYTDELRQLAEQQGVELKPYGQAAPKARPSQAQPAPPPPPGAEDAEKLIERLGVGTEVDAIDLNAPAAGRQVKYALLAAQRRGEWQRVPELLERARDQLAGRLRSMGILDGRGLIDPAAEHMADIMREAGVQMTDLTPIDNLSADEIVALMDAFDRVVGPQLAAQRAALGAARDWVFDDPDRWWEIVGRLHRSDIVNADPNAPAWASTLGQADIAYEGRPKLEGIVRSVVPDAPEGSVDLAQLDVAQAEAILEALRQAEPGWRQGVAQTYNRLASRALPNAPLTDSHRRLLGVLAMEGFEPTGSTVSLATPIFQSDFWNAFADVATAVARREGQHVPDPTKLVIDIRLLAPDEAEQLVDLYRRHIAQAYFESGDAEERAAKLIEAAGHMAERGYDAVRHGEIDITALPDAEDLARALGLEGLPEDEAEVIGADILSSEELDTLLEWVRTKLPSRDSDLDTLLAAAAGPDPELVTEVQGALQRLHPDAIDEYVVDVTKAPVFERALKAAGLPWKDVVDISQLDEDALRALRRTLDAVQTFYGMEGPKPLQRLREGLREVFGVTDTEQLDAAEVVAKALAKYAGVDPEEWAQKALAGFLPGRPIASYLGAEEDAPWHIAAALEHVKAIYGEELTERAARALDEFVAKGGRVPADLKADADVLLAAVARFRQYDLEGDLSQLMEAWRSTFKRLSSTTPLSKNMKTIISIDVTTDCPFNAMGRGCMYCYVIHARLGARGKQVLAYLPYNGDILELPDELVDFLNSVGGVRMYSFGDYVPYVLESRIRDTYERAKKGHLVDEILADAERKGLLMEVELPDGRVERAVNTDRVIEQILEDARQRGLRVKAITKQPEFIDKYAQRFRDILTINYSLDFEPQFMPELERLQPKLYEVMRSGRGLISNALSFEEALNRWGHLPNVVFRYTNLFGPAEAMRAIMHPRIGVVTPYHTTLINPAEFGALVARTWRNPQMFDLAKQIAEVSVAWSDKAREVFASGRLGSSGATLGRTLRMYNLSQELLDSVFGPGRVTVEDFAAAAGRPGETVLGATLSVPRTKVAEWLGVPPTSHIPIVDGAGKRVHPLQVVDLESLFQNAAQGNKQLARLVKSARVSSPFDAGRITQELLDLVFGPDQVKLDDFLQTARRKICCQTGRCATCPVRCGVDKEALSRFLFATAVRGQPVAAAEFLENGRAILSAVKQPGLGPFLHEVGHIFRRQLTEEDLRVASKAVGLVPGSPWDRIHEERFADAFVEYLRLGRAPEPRLERLFERFKDWLLDIWRTIKAHIKPGSINPELREVFDKLMRFAPVEEYEGLKVTPPVSAAVSNTADPMPWYRRLEALLSRGAQEAENTAPPVRVLSEAERQFVREWAQQVVSDLNATKAAAMKAGVMARNFALLDYSQRRAFDNMLSTFLIYPFWPSRTYPNWAIRLATRPAVLSAYLKYRAAVYRANQDAPEWLQKQLRLRVPGIPYPVYFNLEATLNPLYQLLDSFDDPDRRQTALGEAIQLADKLGMSPYPLFVWAYAIERALAGHPEATEAAVGHLAPITRAIKYGTALLHVGPPGGVTPEFWLWRGQVGMGADKWAFRRISRRIADLEMSGQISAKDAREAAHALATGDLENPIVRKAFQMEAEDRGPTTLLSFAFGAGFQARKPTDVEIDEAFAEQSKIYEAAGRVDDDTWRQMWAQFYAKYPWMRTVSLARKDRERADTSYAWDVLRRLPPGQMTNILRDKGVPQEAIDAWFTITKDESLVGDVPRKQRAIAEMPEALRKPFMAAIMELGEEYDVPAAGLTSEWEEARRRYRRLMELAEAEWPGVRQLLDQYYEIRSRSEEQAKRFSEEHPEIWAYRDWLTAVKMQDPLLAWYYAPNPRSQAIDYIWDVYMALTPAEKRRVREWLGPEFDVLFRGKRYDEISNETLLRWVQLLGGQLVRTAEAEAYGKQAPAPQAPLVAAPEQMGAPSARAVVDALPAQ
jgi:hypothetical protein